MKLIMNDGQQVPVQTVTETGGTLKIRLLNQTSAGLKAIFQDALAVQKMAAKETGQADRVYEGYTELVCISEHTGAIWEVEMRKTEADPDTRLAQVEEDVEKLKESGGKIPESARLAIQYATETMTEQQCLDVLEYVERWNPNGVTYKKDKRVAVEEDGSLALYKCLQEHTSQENRKPGMDTASLWTRIDLVHAGDLADPIPWKANMQPEAGKYYHEGDLTAKCVEDPGQPLYNALADLCPGRYFEAA